MISKRTHKAFLYWLRDIRTKYEEIHGKKICYSTGVKFEKSVRILKFYHYTVQKKEIKSTELGTEKSKSKSFQI